ncbi:hypothetical protein Tco_0271309 [Tanacetum coccineum]
MCFLPCLTNSTGVLVLVVKLLNKLASARASEVELEELEEAELGEQLLQPPTAPLYVPHGRQSTRTAPRKNIDEEDELAELRAEMAL